MTESHIAAESAVQGGVTRLSVIRLAVIGAIVSSLFFLLCWVAALVPIGSGPHRYLRLFTNADISSGAALAQGLCWSIVFGALVGGLIALVSNMLGSFGRR